MANGGHRVWVIRSGDKDQAHSDFMDGRICLGWPRVGNLQEIEDNPKTFLIEYCRHYRSDGAQASRLRSSELYRFVHKMDRSDFVIYSSRTDGQVHIGRVRGDYEYLPRRNSHYPHIREVRWASVFRREDLPLEVKFAIGRRSSLYQPRDENLSAVQQILP